jgi:oligopeptide/dipeptide ABC transporter ATP-binding protein
MSLRDGMAESAAPPAVLDVRDLGVTFRRDGVALPVVRGVTFALGRGDRAALVGESGCGKSVTCLALTRLPPTGRALLSGEVLVGGIPVLHDEKAAARVRGRLVAYVFQDSAGSLNPVMRIGAQIAEAIRLRRRRVRRERRERGEARGKSRAVREEAEELLARVRLPDPRALLRAYPCELSGGMRQRVMLAMALAAAPALLVADEPTTALDATTQAEVLAQMDAVVRASGMALLLVTHNLALVAGRCRALHVMYAGEIVESGPAAEVLRHPAHPYTEGLLRAVPSLEARAANPLRDIPGTVPAPGDLPPGCAFAPRCGRRGPSCDAAPPLRRLSPTRLCRCRRPLTGGEGT